MTGFYFLSILTVYTNIFATGFGYILFDCDYTADTLTPTCEHRYIQGILTFCVVGGVIAALDYKEQAVFQYVMMCLQLVVVVVVIIYAFWRMAEPGDTEVVLMDFRYYSQCCAIILPACNFHTVFPSVLAASKKRKSVLKNIILALSLSIIFIYGSIGVSSALTIPNLPSNVSHLFGRESFGYEDDQRPLWVGLLKGLIVLFPVLDISSNTLILAQSLSGVVISLFWGSDHSQVRTTHPFFFRLNRSVWMLPVGLFAGLTHNLVRDMQGELLMIPSMVIFLLIHACVPMSYNRAAVSITHKSHYEFSFPGVKSLNYSISGFFLFTFIAILYSRVA